MSFLPIEQEEQDAPQGGIPAAPSTEAPPTSSGSAGDEGGGPAPTGSATGTPTQFGSSASKLGDYLTANAPQVQGQADKTAANFTDKFKGIQGGINTAAQDFGQQVQGGYAANNPNTVNQAMANPTQFAMNPDSVKAFQGQYNNAYTGPQSFQGTDPYASLQGQIGQATTQGGLLQSQAGLESYLGGQGKGLNSTTASRKLDTLLMRGNPQAQQTIQTAGNQFSGLQGQLDTANAGASKSVTDAQTAAQTSKDYARQGFAGVANPLNENLTNQLGQNQQLYDARGQLSADIYGKMNTNTGASLTAEQSNALGLQPGQFEQLQSINNAGMNFPTYVPTNPGQFYTQNTQQATPPTLGNSATPEQLQTMQALSQLSGGQYQQPFDPQNAGAAFALPQVGTYNAGGANETGRTGLQSAWDRVYANPAAYGSDPNLMSKLQSLQAYLGGSQDLSQFAPGTPLPPGVQLQPDVPVLPTSGGGGRVTYAKGV